MWKSALNMAPNDARFSVILEVTPFHSHVVTIIIKSTTLPNVDSIGF